MILELHITLVKLILCSRSRCNYMDDFIIHIMTVVSGFDESSMVYNFLSFSVGKLQLSLLAELFQV